MFRDYLDMAARGEKKTYSVAVLADRYAVSERTVYNVVKRFSADCNDGAAG
ncbi:MAG: helix-turn-helix domain-containing protein [Muribaculaceae bacterium]|nr:helix-turn-helix domain-containing protein [Muribaculaceae bacterium]